MAFLVPVVYLLQFFKLVLIIRIILSWLPAVSAYDPPWSYVFAVTEPVMKPFRGLLPPIGMIDLSPILLFILLELLIGVLSQMASAAI